MMSFKNRINRPTSAIISITLNCNSRCNMCDIWKNNIQDELSPTDYLKLPNSLKDVNITGGEPFLRPDIEEIINNIKKACPKARLIINTNGFLPQNIKSKIKKILKVDPNIAIRLSLDGWKSTHDQIRNYPNGFNLVMDSLKILKENNVRDLGVSFTIMDKNYSELSRLYRFTQSENIELSLTLVTNSPIYFGPNKINLRPKDSKKFELIIKSIINSRLKTYKPKEWFRAWFDKNLYEFYITHQRCFTCDSGQNFFYLDSTGNIFTCHLKKWALGNIKNHSFKFIWNFSKRKLFLKKVEKCNDCWMICTAKTSIKKNFLKVFFNIISFKKNDIN